MGRLNNHCLCRFIVIVIKSTQYAVIRLTLLLSLACSFLLRYYYFCGWLFIRSSHWISLWLFFVAPFTMLGSVLIVCLSVRFFSVCECVCFCIVLHYFALIVAFTIAWLFVFRIFESRYVRSCAEWKSKGKSKCISIWAGCICFGRVFISFVFILELILSRKRGGSFLVFHSSRIKFWIFRIQ